MKLLAQFTLNSKSQFQILHCNEDDLVPEENANQLHKVAFGAYVMTHHETHETQRKKERQKHKTQSWMICNKELRENPKPRVSRRLVN